MHSRAFEHFHVKVIAASIAGSLSPIDVLNHAQQLSFVRSAIGEMGCDELQ